MEARSEKIKDGLNCFEVGTIVHDGQEYSCGGSCVHEVDGKLQGVLYAHVPEWNGPGNVRPIDKTPYLSSWDGKVKVPCTLGAIWEGNFLDYHGRRQVNRSFWFTLYGRKCRGVQYNLNWQDIVRFKEV